MQGTETRNVIPYATIDDPSKTMQRRTHSWASVELELVDAVGVAQMCHKAPEGIIDRPLGAVLPWV